MIGKIVKASYLKDEYLIKTDLHDIRIAGDVQSFFLDRIVDITEHKGFYPPDGRIISCITVDLGLLSPLDYPRTLSLWALLLRNELRTECTSLFTSPLKEIRREELSSLILLLRASKDRRSP